MGWFSSKIEVTFVNDVTGEAFGVTRLPPEDLPESFELDTTLHLGDDDWSVVDARPTTRAAYTKSKTLILRLRRIEKIDPGELLYSLPSICDFVPPVNDQPLSGSELVLAEDDWRQFEFVSHQLAAEVDDQIAKIRHIHEAAAARVGWREIHVRSQPEPPLVCNLALADLARTLNVPLESHGVTYHGARSPIADGYSFTTADGLSVYGVAPKGNVRVIAFGQYSDASPDPESTDRLKALARDFNLDLVYWCRCVRAAPDNPIFVSLLSKDADS